MGGQPWLLVTDLEGVLVPEIWIAVAQRTGIDQLRLTTRDEPDYDRLMQHRLRILREHRLSLRDIHAVIATLEPLPGAAAFLADMRARMPVIVLSDTYYEFAAPLMAKLGHPTLFCHTLEVDADQMIVGYRLRLPDGKRAAVLALRELQFRVVAMGDSYNDLSMLTAADRGFLFNAPAQIVAATPQLPALNDYAALREAIAAVMR